GVGRGPVRRPAGPRSPLPSDLRETGPTESTLTGRKRRLPADIPEVATRRATLVRSSRACLRRRPGHRTGSPADHLAVVVPGRPRVASGHVVAIGPRIYWSTRGIPGRALGHGGGALVRGRRALPAGRRRRATPRLGP